MVETKDEYGLNQALRLAGLPKKTWYYHQQEKVTDEMKYNQVKIDLLKVVREHPAYGYKRATVELNEKYASSYGRRINKKVVLRLMKDQDIQLISQTKKPKPSAIKRILIQLGDKMNLVAPLLVAEQAGLLTIGLFQIVYTDFTEITYDQGNKKAQLMPIIEHAARIIIGWGLGKTANTKVALIAWQRARRMVKRLGFTTRGLIVHHDRDSVYTGHQWLYQILIVSQAEISYALGGAKDNTLEESFNGHFKGESRDLFWECQTIEELEKVVKEQIEYYNARRRHSSLGQKAPLTYLKERRRRR